MVIPYKSQTKTVLFETATRILSSSLLMIPMKISEVLSSTTRLVSIQIQVGIVPASTTTSRAPSIDAGKTSGGAITTPTTMASYVAGTTRYIILRTAGFRRRTLPASMPSTLTALDISTTTLGGLSPQASRSIMTIYPTISRTRTAQTP